MYQIVSKEQFSEHVYRIEVEAPLIAKARKAGHFVIVRADGNGERIPLTIADANTDKGTITLVVQEVGTTSKKVCNLGVGDALADVVGPLGKATDIKNYGTVVCACGGVGTAPMLPIAKALKNAGNHLIVVLAGRTKDLIILEKEMRLISDEVIVMTDDGSYGRKGLVTNGVEEVLKREIVDKCFAIGPAIMMKFVCLLTKAYNIPTEVSLNTIMVDGTGMCGACRVTVDGKTRFVCIDGPEFDGHKVDFDEMIKRLHPLSSLDIDYAKANNQDNKIIDNISPKTLKATIQKLPNSNDDLRNAAWRVNLRTYLKPKDRLNIPRVKMPKLKADVRARLLKAEVNQGLTLDMAMTEAKRCLDCNNPGCVRGCPVGIDIPRFVKHIEKGEIEKAVQVIKQTSALPAVCGRVCPQEKQCESMCIHHKMQSEPVAIGYLERFAADFERYLVKTKKICIEDYAANKNAPKIAVVGSGPGGLSFAAEMLNRGYNVTIFEALHEIGGVLKYGIPEFRLPNEIVDFEIESLKHKGVVFMKDCIIGKTISVEDLMNKKGFAGVFVATGAGLPNFMGIEGENALGILSSNEYLTRVNLMDASNKLTDTPIPKGKNVVVVGGGNTAMDSVRTALRLGAETATIVYRRSENEMPARLEEVKHAKDEGVRFFSLHNPIRYTTDENGRVNTVILQKMKLGEPDVSGRRRPIPIEGETEILKADLVIVSIGVSPNPILPHSVQGLEVGKKGTIVVNEHMQSSIPMLFAGGDIVRGGATVILAMGDGKKAAAEMDMMIKKKH